MRLALFYHKLIQLKESQENLVRDHFGIFIQCADGLSTLNKRRNEFVPESSDVAKLDGGKYYNEAEIHLKLCSIVLKECYSLTDIILGPILMKTKLNTKIKRYQHVLRELATIIEYPKKIKESFEKKDYHSVYNMYKHLRNKFYYLSFNETKSRIVSYVLTQAKTLLIQMKNNIFKKMTMYCTPSHIIIDKQGEFGSTMISPEYSNNLNEILTDIRFLQQLYQDDKKNDSNDDNNDDDNDDDDDDDDVVHQAFQILLTLFKRNLDIIISRCYRNTKVIINNSNKNDKDSTHNDGDDDDDDDDDSEVLMTFYNNIHDLDYDGESAGGGGDDDDSKDMRHEIQILQSIENFLYGQKSRNDNDIQECEDNTNLSEIRRTRGIHDIKLLCHQTIPLFNALMNMIIMNTTSLSTISLPHIVTTTKVMNTCKNNDYNHHDQFVSVMSMTIKALEKMTFFSSSLALSGKCMRFAISNLYTIYAIVKQGDTVATSTLSSSSSSSAAAAAAAAATTNIDIQSILLSLRLLLFNGKKIWIHKCCQQLSTFGLHIISFHELHQHQRIQIKKLLEKYCFTLSISSSPPVTSLVIYDDTYINKYFFDNEYFLAVYMFQMYLTLSLTHMRRLVNFKMNEINDCKDDKNDQITDIKTLIIHNASKSVQLFFTNLKKLFLSL